MMDVYGIVEAYMRKALSAVSGMKILLVDEETSGIISLVMSQSKLFEFDVFLVDYLPAATGNEEADEREKQKNLNCLVLVRPTAQNIEAVADELKDPKYASYHLFFTNAVKHAQLERIAEADSFEVVKDFQEMFCDYFPLYHSLVSVNVPDSGNVGRFIEGLSSLFYSLKRRPLIRYSSHKSSSTLHFAKELNNLFDVNCDYFSSNCAVEDRPLVLIVDRLDDPITPLLTQWTYQAMLHEFFALKNGRIRLETPGLEAEYVMSLEGDSFYEANLFAPIWKVAEGVQDLVTKYHQMSQMASNFSSIADMKKFMEEYPEYKRLGVHVNKHVTLASELMKLSEAQGLRAMSEFEQELVTSSDWTPQSAWSKLVPFLKPDSSLTRYHKLRLCMLVLAHVGINLPLDSLSRLYGFSDDDVDFLKYFYLTRSEKDQVGLVNTANPSGDDANPFGVLKKGIIGGLSQLTATAAAPEIKAQMTPLTRHVPRIVNILDSLLKDKLPEDTHPYLQSEFDSAKAEKPKEVVIAMLDGCTFEESRFITLCNQVYPGVRVTLASTFVHNNRSYISELVNEWQTQKLQSTQ